MATAKKSSAKKRVTSKRNVSTKKAAQMRTLRIAPNQPGFMTVQLSRQTLYWAVLLIFIILMQLLILNAQIGAINATNLIG